MNLYSEENQLRVKYILIALISLFSWFFLGGIVSYELSLTLQGKLQRFILLFIPHIILFLALFISVKAILKKPLLSLISEKKINIKEELLVALITLLVIGFFSLFSYKTLIKNSDTSSNEKLLFFLVSLPLLLVQTLSEELLFRVLPVKIYSPKEKIMTKKEIIILSIVEGVIFLLPHLSNKEVLESQNSIYAVITYFLWGFGACFISLYYSSFAHSWTMHFVNNLFSCSIIGSVNSTLDSSPLFLDTSTSYSPLILVNTIVLFFVIFFFKKGKSK